MWLGLAYLFAVLFTKGCLNTSVFKVIYANSFEITGLTKFLFDQTNFRRISFVEKQPGCKSRSLCSKHNRIETIE